MIRVCADYGVVAGRIQGLSGTWVTDPVRGPEKIGAIGVRISRWITSHGFAFNVEHRPRLLRADRAVRHRRPRRHLARVRHRPARWPLADVEAAIVRQFCAVFERELNLPTSPQQR